MRYAAALAIAATLALAPGARAQQDADPRAEARALQTMQDALAPMVEAATNRIALMEKYIGDNDLEQAWEGFTPPPAARITSLTFQQALDAAMRHQRLLAPDATTPTAQGVAAGENLVRAQWNNLASLHQQVADLSAFLESKGKLDAYRQWAMDANTPAPPAADQAADQQADQPRTTQQRQADAEKLSQQRYNQLLAGYQEQLDQEQQAQQNANDNPDDDQDYYDGSYWNGYADPYYDVYGVPVVYPYRRLPDHVPGPYWWHDVPHPWDRNNGLLGHAAPVAVHPAIRGRR